MSASYKAGIAVALAISAWWPGQVQAQQRAFPAKPASGLYLGADLSFTNEMEDCGAVFRSKGKPVDPFVLMKAKGGTIARVRLWNDPRWTNYSNIWDMTKTVRRAKAAGLQVLLDFHYSDDWADAGKQITPVAWTGMNPDEQAKALYDFTRKTLADLDAAGLMPEMVQVGNELNVEILGGYLGSTLNWERNAKLINAGLQAVRDAGAAAKINPRVMLHVAQPENIEPWFDRATAVGITNYDVVGISYYPEWSSQSMSGLGAAVASAKKKLNRDVIVVETGYPFSDVRKDSSNNMLSKLLPDYPGTPAGQLKFLTDLTQTTIDNGGIGVVYWEPTWVSTGCRTRWGGGSLMENATWFDAETHEALPAFDFLGKTYSPKRP